MPMDSGEPIPLEMFKGEPIALPEFGEQADDANANSHGVASSQ